MAVKYRLSFSNINLEQVVVEISHPDYVGDVISVIGVGGESYSLSRSAIETPHDSHVIPTTANINLYTDLIDVEELQQANDKEWRVEVTVDAVTDFNGYIVPDGIQKTLKGAGNIVRLSATCGLALLNGVKYTWQGANWGVVNVNGQQSVNLCPINFIRQLLEHQKYVGLDLPIRWYTSIKYDKDPTRDFFAGSMPFSSLNSLADLLTDNDVDTYWILENIVKSAKCTIVQDGGYWNIINYEDLINNEGVLDVLEIPAQNSSVTATVVTTDFNKDISGTQLLDDAYVTFKKSVGLIDVTYSPVIDTNIVSNGDFSDTVSGVFLGWVFSTNPGGAYSTIYEGGAITENGGNSADLVYPATEGQPLDTHAVYSMGEYVSIDADVIFRDLTMGFTFLPLNGFPYNTETGIINWLERPFQVKLEFKSTDGTTYYLNEYGYWQRLPISNFLGYNQFDLATKTWQYVFTGEPIRGNIFVARYKYENLGIITYHEARYVVTMADEVGGLPVLMNNIATSFETQLKPDANWTITSNSNSITVDNTFSGTLFNDGTFLNNQSAGLTSDGFIPFVLGDYKIGDIISVDFRGIGNRNGNILMPKDVGELRMSFKVNEGQRYVIDNVYINIGNNKDVYTLDLGNSNSKETFDLGVSTSVNGFFLSSYRDNTSLLGQYYEMTDYSGASVSLTELYGRGVLNWRNKARKIYNGTFKADIPYISLVTIGSDKYIPTGMDSNKTNGQLTLQGFQAVLDVVSPTVVHKGSNDDNLNK